MNLRLLAVRAAQSLLLPILALLGWIALLQSLVWGKEGFGLEDLGTAGLWLAGLAAAAAVWWAACRRAAFPAPRPLLWTGLFLLALPFSCVAGLGGWTAVNGVRAARVARDVRIVRYAETPLVPPGLDGPIGLRIELTLAHPPLPEGNLLPPRVVLTGPGVALGDYFAVPFSPAGRWMLERPLMQPLSGSERNRRVLATPGPTALSYDLYAAPVRAVSPTSQICLEKARGDTAASDPHAAEMSAAWVFHADGGFVVRVGTALTRTLRHSSRFAGRANEWKAMTRRSTAENLQRAGYTPCRSDNALLNEGSCWCPRGAS